MSKQYVSPTGAPIQGTLELLSGVCRVDGVNDDGTPSYLESGTEIFWDDQQTAKKNGKLVYLDLNGAEWTFDQLKLQEETMADDGMKPFNLTMEWGQQDEGLYHWSGRAKDLDDAFRLAREEMDDSYNGQYAKGEFADEMRRGIAAGEETTEYVMADYSEGVNEFAASDMLDALKLIADTYKLEEADMKIVQDAIARGEGRA
jgi:hypothetical protein